PGAAAVVALTVKPSTPEIRCNTILPTSLFSPSRIFDASGIELEVNPGRLACSSQSCHGRLGPRVGKFQLLSPDMLAPLVSASVMPALLIIAGRLLPNSKLKFPLESL